VPSARSTGAT